MWGAMPEFSTHNSEGSAKAKGARTSCPSVSTAARSRRVKYCLEIDACWIGAWRSTEGGPLSAISHLQSSINNQFGRPCSSAPGHHVVNSPTRCPRSDFVVGFITVHRLLQRSGGGVTKFVKTSLRLARGHRTDGQKIPGSSVRL